MNALVLHLCHLATRLKGSNYTAFQFFRRVTPEILKGARLAPESKLSNRDAS